MTLPEMTYITVFGGFKKGDGTPEVGTVAFKRTTRLISPGEGIIVSPWEKEVPLDSDGNFTVDLPASDDSDYSPTFTYEVTESLSGGTARYTIDLPAATPDGEVNLATKSPIVGDASGTAYVLLAMVGQPNGVAGLDSDGKVPLSQLPPISGGGEGGGTPASTVVQEKTYGQNHAVGTSTDYARADHSHGTPPAQTLADLGGEEAGTAADLIAGHVAASDPHGDREYSDTQLGEALEGKADVGHTHGSSSQAIERYIETAVQGEGLLKWRNNSGATQNIIAVRAEVMVAAPQGGPLTVDVNINGTTIFTTQANRPVITSGNFDSGRITNMDITEVADGQYITVDIDTIGTTVPGSGVLVTVVVG